MAKKIENINILKEQIIESFPKLESDTDFAITSPDTPIYNCIAWACNYSDRWMWPKNDDFRKFDAIQYWPNGVENNEDVTAFISAFELEGYSLCDSYNHEDGFQKIALYVEYNTTKCTHAARERVGDKKVLGKWTSKLGRSNDIQHATPYTIEGDCYGVVYCFMKRKFP